MEILILRLTIGLIFDLNHRDKDSLYLNCLSLLIYWNKDYFK